MKIVKKSLFYIDENDRIIITDKYALEKFKSMIPSGILFRLEYEPDGFFISSNHINSILFNICAIKKYELQIENVFGVFENVFEKNMFKFNSYKSSFDKK